MDLVAMVVDHPQQLVQGRGRTIAQSRWMTPAGKEHLLRVVFEELGEDKLVVTVYDTSKVEKYWRVE